VGDPAPVHHDPDLPLEPGEVELTTRSVYPLPRHAPDPVTGVEEGEEGGKGAEPELREKEEGCSWNDPEGGAAAWHR